MSESDKQKNAVQERRIAPRYKINLRSSVLITVVRTLESGKESFLFLQAHLRDVSLTGMALIISYVDVKELNAFGKDLTFNLLLPLPAEAIELKAVPIRYLRLDEREDGNVLVGTHITDMNGRDRVLFMSFIRENENSPVN